MGKLWKITMFSGKTYSHGKSLIKGGFNGKIIYKSGKQPHNELEKWKNPAF